MSARGAATVTATVIATTARLAGNQVSKVSPAALQRGFFHHGFTGVPVIGAGLRGAGELIACSTFRSSVRRAELAMVRRKPALTLASPSPLWLSTGSLSFDGPSLVPLVGSLITQILV